MSTPRKEKDAQSPVTLATVGLVPIFEQAEEKWVSERIWIVEFLWPILVKLFSGTQMFFQVNPCGRQKVGGGGGRISHIHYAALSFNLVLDTKYF